MIIKMRRRTDKEDLLILAALVYLMTMAGPVAAGNASDLTGLWTFRCEEDQIFGDPLVMEEFTAAILQMGTILSGAATGGETEPWNGMVSGSLQEGRFEAEILLIRQPLAVAVITGIIQEPGDLAGTIVSSDERGRGWMGRFSATMTSPDISSYQPAAQKPVSFVPTISGGISDFEELTLPAPVEEAPKRRQIQVISYTRDTIYARPVM